MNLKSDLNIKETPSYLLDTNVILRFLIKDNPTQLKQAMNWFKKAESGAITIIIEPIVVAETCFVLESFYKNSRAQIADTMEVFLSQRWLKVNQREILISIWKWYLQGFHFVDSYLIAYSNIQKAKLLSFDKKALKQV